MFCVTSIRLAAIAVACGGILAAAPAQAADVDEPGYPPPGAYGRYEPEPPQAYNWRLRPPADVPVARCRIRHERDVDGYGREIVRRVRICDEGVVAVDPYRGHYDRRVYAPPPGAWSGPAGPGPEYDDDDRD